MGSERPTTKARETNDDTEKLKQQPTNNYVFGKNPLLDCIIIPCFSDLSSRLSRDSVLMSVSDKTVSQCSVLGWSERTCRLLLLIQADSLAGVGWAQTKGKPSMVSAGCRRERMSCSVVLRGEASPGAG